MEPFCHHVFICTQAKPEGVTSCPGNSSWLVLRALERELFAQGLDDEVQVTTCGCLGLCDDGPVMITYPEGVWYRKVKEEDVPEIVSSHLRSNKFVSRLVWSDSHGMKAEVTEHREHYRAMVKAKDEGGILPDDLNEMIRALMPSRTVLTALELDIFTAAGTGASAEDVARKINAYLTSSRNAAECAGPVSTFSKKGMECSSTRQPVRVSFRCGRTITPGQP